MNDDEIKKLGVDIRAGRVFGSWMVAECDQDLLVSIFLVMRFMDSDALTELQRQEPAAIYEYMSEAGGRSVNGYPTFLSMKTLDKNDLSRLVDVMKALERAESAVLASA